MYFKYYSTEEKGLAIKKADCVKIVTVYYDGEDATYRLVPSGIEREHGLLDAAISRFATLMRGVTDVTANLSDAARGWAPVACKAVCHQMGDDAYWEALAHYETLEEANAEMENIAESIASGCRLYDLTQHRGM